MQADSIIIKLETWGRPNDCTWDCEAKWEVRARMPWEGPQRSPSGAWMWPQAGELGCELCTEMHFEKIIFGSVPQSKYFDFIPNHFPGQWPSFFISDFGRGKAGEETDLTPLLLCLWIGHLGAIAGAVHFIPLCGQPTPGPPWMEPGLGSRGRLPAWDCFQNFRRQSLGGKRQHLLYYPEITRWVKLHRDICSLFASSNQRP